LLPSNQDALGQTARPEEVKFPSAKLALHGVLYKPEGNGPFPAILYNHGSEKDPGSKPALGVFFSSRGYVFFVPHRRGHGRSPASLIDWSSRTSF
jgi:dipeptidyl aminopeptidase/acylaminoacyl peptidase